MIHHDYPTRLTANRITEEGRRIIREMDDVLGEYLRRQHIIKRYTEVVKPFRGGIKPHKMI
jgi:hypothetical protein